MITHKKVVMINIKIFSLLVRHHCDHVDAGETWKKENHGNRILFNFSLLLSSIYLFWKVRVKFLNCFYKVMSPFSWKEMFKMITRLSMAPCFLYWSGKVIAEFEMPLSWYDYPIHTEFTSIIKLVLFSPLQSICTWKTSNQLGKALKKSIQNAYVLRRLQKLRNDVLYGILRKDELSLLIQNNSLFTLFVYFSHRTMMTVFIFGVRGFISGAFQGFYVYTPEVHVTDWTKNDTKENM